MEATSSLQKYQNGVEKEHHGLIFIIFSPNDNNLSCSHHRKLSPSKFMQKNQIDKNIHIESRQNVLTKKLSKICKILL